MRHRRRAQSGVRLFVAMLETGDEGDGPSEPIAIINPEITPATSEVVEDWEGCLSIPELRGRVPRWRKLRVNALDRHGNPVEWTAEGFTARVVQHEFDHLMGKVYLDRMRDFKTLTHLSEFQRYWLPEEAPSPSGSSQRADGSEARARQGEASTEE